MENGNSDLRLSKNGHGTFGDLRKRLDQEEPDGSLPSISANEMTDGCRGFLRSLERAQLNTDKVTQPVQQRWPEETWGDLL